MFPEKMGSLMAPVPQGVSNDPWATLCSLGKKENSRTSPTSAVVVFGEKVSPPEPTSTGMVFAKAPEVRVAAAIMELEKRMLRGLCYLV